MNRPSLAVVVPCYLQESYLFRLLSSVIWQLEPSDEVIIVNDNDGPLAFAIPEFAKSKVRLLENGVNKGVSFSRNRAIREARAEWIKFLDADDVLCPFALDVLGGTAAVAESVQLVTGGCHRIIDGSYADYICPDEGRFDAILCQNPTLPSLAFVRRTALLEVGLFNEQIDHEEDWEMWLRLHERYGRGCFHIVNQPVCYYWISQPERDEKQRSAKIDGQPVREYLRERYKATPFSGV